MLLANASMHPLISVHQIKLKVAAVFDKNTMLTHFEEDIYTSAETMALSTPSQYNFLSGPRGIISAYLRLKDDIDWGDRKVMPARRIQEHDS